MPTDQLYMRRALDLASLGLGKVRPNPMVGCVIVQNDTIIGEGWHQIHGGPHAEVEAIESVQEKKLLERSTIYVTLEPCAHHGKTPPCADLLAHLNPARVVVAQMDPNPLVCGKGTNKLRSTGIEVSCGILAEEAANLNKRFITFFKKQRPYIILKWATTTEEEGHSGFLAREDYDSKWISNRHSRKLVHQWRGEEAAVMVGTNTAHYDDPKLNVRDWSGSDPVRIVIDKKLRLNASLHLFSDQKPTICYNLQMDKQEGEVIWVKLGASDFISTLLKDLYDRGIQSILVEGGAALHRSLMEVSLWDEARVFRGSVAFGAGIAAPDPLGVVLTKQDIMGDQLTTYRNTDG